MLYKQIEDGILTAIGDSSAIGENQTEITQAEYDSIMDIIRNKPEDTEEVVYKLNAETLVYDEYPAPPAPETKPYDIPMETYNQIIDDYSATLVEEVSSNGY